MVSVPFTLKFATVGLEEAIVAVSAIGMQALSVGAGGPVGVQFVPTSQFPLATLNVIEHATGLPATVPVAMIVTLAVPSV